MRAVLALALLPLAVSARAAEVKLPAALPLSVPLAAPVAPAAVLPAAVFPAAPTLPPQAEISAMPAAAPPVAPALAAAVQAEAIAAPQAGAANAGGLSADVSEGALRFDGAAVRHDEETLAAARASTSAEVERLLTLKRKGVKVHQVLASKDTKTITEYRGVPDRVAALPDDGTVYRHWVRSEEDLRSILAASKLRAGPVSYVEFTGSQHAFIKDIYLDLHGVFFTAPEKSSSEPRVMNEAVPHYVDFRLPRGVRALRLDGKDVMMIPAERGAYIPVEIVGSSDPRYSR